MSSNFYTVIPCKIGELSPYIIETLALTFKASCPIYIGAKNIEHMKYKHAEAYKKYGKYIPDIISSPDYVGHRSDGSIEFIKEYRVNDEFVKLAVRASGANILYARTLYIVNPSSVKNHLRKGTLKPVKL